MLNLKLSVIVVLINFKLELVDILVGSQSFGCCNEELLTNN